MLRDFPTWKNPEEILRYADLAVCDRAEESEKWREEEQAKFFARFKKRFETVNYKATSVSSTEARVKAAAGDDTSALCGAAVAEYIRAHRLYEIPNAHEAPNGRRLPRRCFTTARKICRFPPRYWTDFRCRTVCPAPCRSLFCISLRAHMRRNMPTELRTKKF